MFNFFIQQILNGLDWIYTNYLTGFFSKISDLFSYISNNQALFNQILGIIYFIFGKNLIIFGLSVGLAIVTIKIVMAIINLVGQFVP